MTHMRKNYQFLMMQSDESNLSFESPVVERIPDANSIKTSHYTWYNFIFKNLFEQFHRLANIFFLFCATLQVIPVISPLNPVMGFLSLSVMLSISMIKVGLEDLKRHKADNLLNNKITRLYQNGREVESKWKEINQGDILIIRDNEEFPADCVLLKTTSSDNKCKIETAALDGESNLKIRTVVTPDDDLINEKFSVEICETRPELNIFSGNIKLEGRIYSLSPENFIPRACFLKNTREVYALVVYTGENTKIIQNSIKPKFKYTEIDRFMSRCVIILVFVLLGLAGIFDLFAYKWTEEHYQDQYLQLQRQPKIYYFYNLFSWFLIINMMIPLCMYSSLDLVRFFLALYFEIDKSMVEGNSKVRCHTSDLVSTIGRITHIISDKTGTLTKNKMTFRAVGLEDGIIGGNGELKVNNDSERMISMSDANLEYVRNQISHNPKLRELLLTICLCHSATTAVNQYYYNPALISSVFPDFEFTYDIPPIEVVKKFPYSISYQTSSPDEVALLHFARECGYIFYTINQNIVTLIINDAIVEIERPVFFEFTAKRKRASCLVKINGEYKLLMKGADTEVLRRSISTPDTICRELKEISIKGLRSLLYSEKIVYSPYKIIEEFNRIKTLTSGFDEALYNLQEEVEQELSIFAVTGVMDELQDEVQETICKLRQAGISIWMLTGDKLDTALNVAAAAGLKLPDFHELVISSIDDIEKMAGYNLKNTVVVIEGQVMSELFTDNTFFDYAENAGCVVCARCEPSQKGACVREFKKHKKRATILSIGDGANDVDMIRSADVGVGVEGKEGSDAVMSSDFSLPSFKFIAPLLIIHGRWSVNRTTLLVSLIFYKNTMLCFTQMLFGIFNGFSATSAFDSGFLSMYNFILTVPQLFFICVFEEDVDAKYAMAVPETYKDNSKQGTIGVGTMIWMYVHAAIHALIIFFFSYFESNSVLLDSSCKTFDLPIFSQITAWCVLIVFTLELLMSFKTITIVHILLYVACIIVYIAISFFYSFSDKMFYNIVGIAFSVPRIWLIIPFVVGCCIIIDMIAFYWKPIIFPSISDSVSDLEHIGNIKLLK